VLAVLGAPLTLWLDVLDRQSYQQRSLQRLRRQWQQRPRYGCFRGAGEFGTGGLRCCPEHQNYERQAWVDRSSHRVLVLVYLVK
jgi:hypothetical protein